MNKINRVHWYFLFLMILQIVLPIGEILEAINITDIRIGLLLMHTIGFIIPGIVYIKIIRKESLKKILRLNKIKFKDTFFVVILGFTCIPVMMFISLVTQFFFDNTVAEFMDYIITTPYIILLLLVAVLPSISEEVTIRGIILDGYENKNMYVASIMTGLLFGIMHLNSQQFLYTAVLGFILALVVRITNSIYPAMIMHFIINGTSITIQKAYEYLATSSESSVIVEEVGEISLKTISILEKIIITGFYGVIAIVFGVISFLIINKLYKDNIKIDAVSFRSDTAVKKERVIDIPFILIIIFYVIVMLGIGL